MEHEIKLISRTITALMGTIIFSQVPSEPVPFRFEWTLEAFTRSEMAHKSNHLSSHSLALLRTQRGGYGVACLWNTYLDVWDVDNARRFWVTMCEWDWGPGNGLMPLKGSKQRQTIPLSVHTNYILYERQDDDGVNIIRDVNGSLMTYQKTN